MTVAEYEPQTVVLRAPKSRMFIPLLRLIIGGAVARQNLGVDQLSDLQLAMETLVVEERAYEGELTLTVSWDPRSIAVTVAGLCNADVLALLQDDSQNPEPHRSMINMRILLESLVDDHSVITDTGECFAVRLEKRTLQLEPPRQGYRGAEEDEARS